MFRSIRAAIVRCRQARAKALARTLLLESLEQRRLLAVDSLLSLTSIDHAPTAAIYGPAQAGDVQPEGEGQQPSTTSASRQLLFAGIAGSTASPTNSGLLTIINPSAGSPNDVNVPWNAPLVSGGITGLAFELSGRLFATVDQGPCTPSELVELNPTNGAVLRRLPIMFGSTEINIGDLAIEPATGRLFGARSIHDDASHAGELFVIDIESGEATFIGDTGTGMGEGLAFASDGTLYLAGTASGKPVLYKIDQATGEPHQRDPVTGLAMPFLVLQDPSGRLKQVEGLAGHPDNGTLIATTSMTRFAGTQIVDDTYAIDLATGNVMVQPLATPARGIFGDLAFQPSPRMLDLVYQENFESGIGGFVTNNTGGTLPGLWHYSLGRRFDNLPSHTPINSFYYGAFETAFGGGHYVLPLDHEGILTSPLIQLPTASVLSFNYLLDTRPELDVDFVSVSIITADGSTTQILSRADGTLPQTGRQQWRTATADLSAFACQPVQLQFSFDTGPVPTIDPEGWYIDDLLIASAGGFCDFGDAPDAPTNSNDFPTLLVSNGARHGIVEGLHLGASVDQEADGQPTLMADGDDNDANGDDEDGVTFVTSLVPGEVATVEVIATGMGLLNAWIDFNADHTWNVDEMVFRDVPLANETKQLTFTVPVSAVPTEQTFARFRFSTQAGLSFSGLAVDGEVEDHTLKIDQPAPSITIDKRFVSNADEDGSMSVTLGDTLTYHFEVTNDGNQTLIDVLVTDPLPGLSQIVPSQLARLAPGATELFTATYVVRQSDMDDPDEEINNTATVTATDPQGGTQTGMDDEAVMVTFDPSIEIDKSFLSNADEDGSMSVTRGDTLTYRFDVTNTGLQTLTNIIVSDPLPGLSAVAPSEVAQLAPGEMATFTATYVVQQSDMDDPDMEINNTATVVATDPLGDTHTSTDDEAVMVSPVASLTFDKFLFNNADEDGSGTAGVTLGDTLTYRFVVTNSGNTTLTNVMVSDPLSGLSAINPSAVASLAPGEMATFSATYVVRQTDMDDPDEQINNIATATAIGPKGNTLTGVDSEAVMVKFDPSIAIDKSLFSNADEDATGTVTLDDTLTYHFDVVNTGLQTLTDIIVSDLLPGLSAVSPSVVASLSPGAAVTFTATYVVQQSDINDPDGEINNLATVTGTDPKGNPQTNTDTETVPVPSVPIAPQLVQFITPMSVFRPDGPFAFLNLDVTPRDPNAEFAISGFKWHDLNQDGIWNANEPGRPGWRIYIDVDDDNEFDPQNSAEPAAITASDGSYVFTAADLSNLMVGQTYAIREDRAGLSDGTFQVQRFPAPAPDVQDADEHLFQWAPGTVIQGAFGAADVPNFGTFDYSPFIRPADEQLRHFRLLPATDKVSYLAALSPWQSIDIPNNTGSSFQIIGVDASMISAPGNSLVQIVDANGVAIGPANPITVGVGSTAKLYAFYDPAQRADDQVVTQFPEWLPGSEPNGSHTFAQGDRLLILTDATIAFRVDLVGGSTYDSDIFYDAAVNRLDLGRLSDDLLTANQGLPIVEGATPLFDLTSDINTRCPNGAEGIINSCSWGPAGPPLREIAFGDFGTLNVEFGRARAAFLDLDADNSSGSKGVDYTTEFNGSAVPIVDSDGRFANFSEQVLAGLSVVLTNPAPGDQLTIDKTKLPDGISVDDSNPSRLEFTTSDVGTAGTLFDYNTVLSLIRFLSNDASPAGTRFIETSARGSLTAGSGRSFASGEASSNVAVTRVLVIRP